LAFIPKATNCNHYGRSSDLFRFKRPSRYKQWRRLLKRSSYTPKSPEGDLAFVLRLTTRDLLLKELTAAGTVQDLHLFPFRIAPEWNNSTKMRVKDKQNVEVEKEKFWMLFIALKSKTNLQT
jgi:hypothetical protein